MFAYMVPHMSAQDGEKDPILNCVLRANWQRESMHGSGSKGSAPYMHLFTSWRQTLALRKHAQLVPCRSKKGQGIKSTGTCTINPSLTMQSRATSRIKNTKLWMKLRCIKRTVLGSSLALWADRQRWTQFRLLTIYSLSVHDAQFPLLLLTRDHCRSASPSPSVRHAHLISTCDFVWWWSRQGWADWSCKGFFGRGSENSKMIMQRLCYFISSLFENPSLPFPLTLSATFAFDYHWHGFATEANSWKPTNIDTLAKRLV